MSEKTRAIKSIDFENGDQIHIIRKDKSTKDNKEIISQVREQTKAGLIVDIPDTETLPFEIGDVYYIQVFREGDCLEMQTRVIEKQLEPIPLLYILKTHKITKIQKRAYVRIDVMIPVNFSQFYLEDSNDTSAEKDKPVDKTVYSGRVINISGGGLVISSIKNFHPGEYLRCNYTLPILDVEIEKIIGKIIKCSEVEDEGYHIIIEFVGITDAERTNIIKYVFEEQRRMRIKGVI